MPAGLDGNPDPIVTPERTAVVEAVAGAILDRKAPGSPLLVAIDGIDGSGKSTFADELARELARQQVSVVRTTIDSFHNTREVRYRRGPTSPVGFFLDSHDLGAVQAKLLDPFAAGSGVYESAIFDVERDAAIQAERQQVGADDVLVFDGIFAQRDELVDYWDFVVFLDAQQRVDLSRLDHVLTNLPTAPVDVVGHVLEWDRRIDRYSSGQRFYLDLVDPISKADLVIDNNDLAHPRIGHTMQIDHEVPVTASARQVYELVSDVTRIGEWSPECVESTWISGEPGEIGSQFVGSNYEHNVETGRVYEWDMTNEVVEASAPHIFAWSVLTEAWDSDTSVWRFTIAETEVGVVLKQSYRMARPPQGWQPILDRHGWQEQVELVAARRARLDAGMQSTLAAIATVFET